MAIEALEAKQGYVYPDAADFGTKVRAGDKMWKLTQQLVDWYGVKGTRTETRYATGVTVSHVVELMDEWNTGAVSRFKITFVSDRSAKDFDGYIEVEELESNACTHSDDRVCQGLGH